MEKKQVKNLKWGDCLVNPKGGFFEVISNENGKVYLYNQLKRTFETHKVGPNNFVWTATKKEIST